MTPLAPLALARLGAIRVALSASDACLRLQRCAPSPPSGGPQAISMAEIQQGRLIQDLTGSWKSAPSTTKPN